jgi:RNA polymerase sigma-70 factor (ECF subfamily)
MAQRDDSEIGMLARAAARGDGNAFTRLYRATIKQVHNQVGRMLGWSASVEDVVHEVYLEVFKSLPAFQGESAFSTWLFRVTHNVSVSYLRRQGSRPVELAAISTLAIAVHQPDFDARQQVQALYDALEHVPEDARECFILYEIEGLSLKEIADTTGNSLNTIASRIRRTRERLGRLLERDATARRKAR